MGTWSNLRRGSGACFIGLAFALTVSNTSAADALVGQPLSARSGPRGRTLFATLAPHDTGVITENHYDDPRIWAERYPEFSVGAIGTGVAIGDYDADGRPDIFVVSKTGSCRLFRNLGDWKFVDVTEHAGVADRGSAVREWKQGAAFADVNNDGWLDLYVTRFDAPNLLYVNQGDGTFREEAVARGLAIRDASGAASFCDYDRDGWLDLYLLTNVLSVARGPQGQPDYLFHNNGDGTFNDVTARAGMSGAGQGHSATWWDYDADGWPDLYVANDFAVRDRLYRNQRDGTFTDVIDAVMPVLPHHSMGSDVGDFDNDGWMDLFVADMARTSHAREQETIAETRVSIRPEMLAGGRPPQTMRNALYLSSADGRCREAAHLAGLAATDWTWSVRAEDLDNDGRVDLHVTNGMVRDYDNADLRARLMAAESSMERVRIVRQSPVSTDTNQAYRNRGDLVFEEVGAAWGLNQKGVSFGAAFGDLDGDGDLDLVFGNYQVGATVLRNDSDTGHRLVIALRGTRSNRFGVGARVTLQTARSRQVRQSTVTRGYQSTSEPILHFGLGEESRIERLTVEWPSGFRQTWADLAADRRLTITEPDEAARATAETPATAARFESVAETFGLSIAARELPSEAVERAPFVSQRFDRRGPALALADLDGDGTEELVVGGTTLDPARWWRRAADGRWREGGVLPVAYDGITPDGPLLVMDVNGDGETDVLVTKSGDALPAGAPGYGLQLLLGNGQGGFSATGSFALPDLGGPAGAAAAADFNRDGRVDVFVGGRLVPGQYPQMPKSVLLVNRAGGFDDRADALAPGLSAAGLVTAALWSDVDSDGWVDLVVASEWGGVQCWRNEQGRRLVNIAEQIGFTSAGTGWWTSLATADFNRDGRMDYVLGNVGLNTRYAASPEQPALLFAGEFGSAAGPLVIEAQDDRGRVVPWPTLRQMRAKLPSVRQRFTRNAAYARATLGEIVGEENLAAAARWTATELRSGVLLSQTNGTYRFAALPRLAQIAPLQGVVATDFDGDGCADIYAVQNSFAPVPGVGPFSGGLSQLLLGDGAGGFHAMPPRESGLVVAGDAKAVVVIDLDGDSWPDVVITRNDATMLAFRNHGVRERAMLAVRVRGEPGSVDAIGARVTMSSAAGAVEMAEIAAGSGYFSQSGPTVYFGVEAEDPPRQVVVRWPTGETTQHAVPAGARLIEVAL